MSLANYEALGGVLGSIEATAAAAFEKPGNQPVVPADKAVVGTQERWLAPTISEAEAQLARAAQVSLLIAQLNGHESPVISAAFSPDSKRVVTASLDKTALIWDVSWLISLAAKRIYFVKSLHSGKSWIRSRSCPGSCLGQALIPG